MDLCFMVYKMGLITEMSASHNSYDDKIKCSYEKHLETYKYLTILVFYYFISANIFNILKGRYSEFKENF